jgi:hypothetical protein
VYVVNRRTVVDQATEEASKLRDALRTDQRLHSVAETLARLTVRSTEHPAGHQHAARRVCRQCRMARRPRPSCCHCWYGRHDW